MTSIDYNWMYKDCGVYGDTYAVDIWYPRLEDSPVKKVRVGLMDVRAADDIIIKYDFDRDGWSIEQASKFSVPTDTDMDDNPWDYQEVAFVQAWGREVDEENNEEALEEQGPGKVQVRTGEG